MPRPVFPKTGKLFAERYRIDSEIGSGGFARIFLASDVELERRVAIKVMKPRYGNDDTDKRSRKLMLRFQREARLVAKLRDPHTITVFDYGQSDTGLLYMVSEYIDGQDLSQALEEHGEFSPERTVTIMTQALMSLQEAHELGVLHRDIKPANIMLYEHVGRLDQVKVLDFGIAKMIAEDPSDRQTDLTAENSIVGTPRYMAPEQIRGKGIGAPTDLYSLGLVSFEMLTGDKANKGKTTLNIITEQVNLPSFSLPPEMDIPAGLRSIIDGMLEKNADARYQDAQSILDALESWDQQANLAPEHRAPDGKPTVKVGAVGPGPSERPTVKVDTVESTESAPREVASSPTMSPSPSASGGGSAGPVAVDDDGGDSGDGEDGRSGTTVILGVLAAAAVLVAAASVLLDQLGMFEAEPSDPISIEARSGAPEDSPVVDAPTDDEGETADEPTPELTMSAGSDEPASDDESSGAKSGAQKNPAENAPREPQDSMAPDRPAESHDPVRETVPTEEAAAREMASERESSPEESQDYGTGEHADPPEKSADEKSAENNQKKAGGDSTTGADAPAEDDENDDDKPRFFDVTGDSL